MSQHGPQSEAIRAATSDPDLPTEAAELYEGILETVRDTTDASRRSIIGLLLVAGITELLNQAAVSGFQLGPLSVTDVSSIRKILPPVAAYLIYDIMTCSIRAMYSRRLLAAINRTYRPGLYASHYARLTYPRPSSLLGPFPWHDTSQTTVYKVIKVFMVTLKIGFMATPPLLLVHWSVNLFDAFGFADPLVWVSITLSAGFAVLAVLVVLEGVHSDLINIRGILG